jgi:hypothetical protein
MAAQKENCSFLKKRTKKLLFLGVSESGERTRQRQKSFASFLQKRRPSFLLTASTAPGAKANRSGSNGSR